MSSDTQTVSFSVKEERTFLFDLESLQSMNKKFQFVDNLQTQSKIRIQNGRRNKILYIKIFKGNKDDKLL